MVAAPSLIQKMPGHGVAIPENTCRHLTVALGIIVGLGSLVAAGCLFSRLGYSSFGIGTAGIAAGGMIAWMGRRGCLKTQVSTDAAATNQTPKQTYTSEKRAAIFQETLAALDSYDSKKMIAETKTYGYQAPLRPSSKYITTFSVERDDTLNVLCRLATEGKNPVGINMASALSPGGGVLQGATGQEESICRRSNHSIGLNSAIYPLHPLEVIYCPHVTVFREDEAHDYAMMAEPKQVALVAVPPFDLRAGSQDRFLFNLADTKHETLTNNNSYLTSMSDTIHTMLRIMAAKGHTHLVLEAFGCEIFENDPSVMAALFISALREPEFKGRFEQVIFAIDPTQDAKIAPPFEVACNILSAP